MVSSLASLCLLLLAFLCSVDGQNIIPKCSDTTIAKIKAYYAKNGAPTSMAEGSNKWTILYYSSPPPSPVCVKQKVGKDNVESTLINTQTNAVVFKSVVTFSGGIQNGLVKQTVKGTGQKIHLHIIKSTKRINVFYMCDPNSKYTSPAQGGVAAPIGKDTDEATVKEANKMKKILAAIGVTTYVTTPCKK